MTIPPELEAQILRYHHVEKWRIGTIATQLGHHHSTVRRVLSQAGLDAGLVSVRPSMVDLYVPFIQETLKKYPRLCASRLFVMVKERGYPGKPDHFRTIRREADAARAGSVLQIGIQGYQMKCARRPARLPHPHFVTVTPRMLNMDQCA